MLLLGFVLLAACQQVLFGDEVASTSTTTPQPDVPDEGGESNFFSSGNHENKTSDKSPLPSTLPYVDPKIFTKEHKSLSLILRRISPGEYSRIQELCGKRLVLF